MFKRLLIVFFRTFYLYFKVIVSPSRDVLYVSGCPGGSKFYRCDNQKEELKKFGITASIFPQQTPFIDLLVAKHEKFIFQRVIADQKTLSLFYKIKKQGKQIIYETDDLVFDPEYIKYMAYFDQMESQERGWYLNGIGREFLVNSYVKTVVVSTDVLKKAVVKKYPDKTVFVSHNKLSNHQVRLSENVLNNQKQHRPDDGKIRIGYFSGSHSHDRDFAVISDALSQILKNNKQAILMIVGPLSIGKSLDAFQSQIERFDFVPLDRYFEIMIKADINIAPLEIDNSFCQAKSALKFFESGLLRIPTIATATAPYQSAITHGQNGFLACEDNDWSKYLTRLISDKGLRRKIGENAYEAAKINHTIASLSKPSSFIQFLENDLIR